jgi:arylamine N-acetyltransferase
MSLLHGEVFQWGATDAQMRLIYREPANPIVQGIWTLEHRISKSHDWTPSYEFGMTEFLQEDFEVMNYATSSRRTSFFTWSIVCLKMVLDRDLEDITGAMILTGKSVKRRLFGESEVVVECSNESQRVAALSEHFGIDLSKRGTSKYQGYFDRSQRRLEASKDKESERRGAGL